MTTSVKKTDTTASLYIPLSFMPTCPAVCLSLPSQPKLLKEWRSHREKKNKNKNRSNPEAGKQKNCREKKGKKMKLQLSESPMSIYLVFHFSKPLLMFPLIRIYYLTDTTVFLTASKSTSEHTSLIPSSTFNLPTYSFNPQSMHVPSVTVSLTF